LIGRLPVFGGFEEGDDGAVENLQDGRRVREEEREGVERERADLGDGGCSFEGIDLVPCSDLIAWF